MNNPTKHKNKIFNINIILNSYETGHYHWGCDTVGEKKTEFCALQNVEKEPAKLT